MLTVCKQTLNPFSYSILPQDEILLYVNKVFTYVGKSACFMF